MKKLNLIIALFIFIGCQDTCIEPKLQHSLRLNEEVTLMQKEVFVFGEIEPNKEIKLAFIKHVRDTSVFRTYENENYYDKLVQRHTDKIEIEILVYEYIAIFNLRDFGHNFVVLKLLRVELQ